MFLGRVIFIYHRLRVRPTHLQAASTGDGNLYYNLEQAPEALLLWRSPPYVLLNFGLTGAGLLNKTVNRIKVDAETFDIITNKVVGRYEAQSQN